MHLRPAYTAALFVFPLLLAGCTGAPSDDEDGPTPTPPASTVDTDPVLYARTGCFGFNALFFVDGAAMRAHVPENWTFSSLGGTGQLSILRVHVVGCAEGFDLSLSSPMVPDAASLHHHDNPDVVLGFYSDNATTVERMRTAGIPAEPATFDWQETPQGDTLAVAGDEAPILALDALNPHRSIITNAYAWPATYAAGTDPIAWYWGHENTTARNATVLRAVFGAGSPTPGLQATPWQAQVWLGYDVEYALGAPDT